MTRGFYGIEQPKISFNDLESKDQIKLIYILKNNTKKSINEIFPPNYHEENKEHWVKSLNKLLEIRAISISPKNKPFIFFDKDFPKSVCVERAIYNVNISFENNSFKQIEKDGFFKDNIAMDLKLEMLKEYIYLDAIKKFEILLKERNLFKYIARS